MTHFCIESNLYVPTQWIISFDCSLKTSNAKKRIHNIFLPLAPVPSKYGCECPSVPARARLYAGHSAVSAIRLTISPPTCVPIAAAGDSGHTFLQPTLNTQLLTLGCQADPGHWWPGEITLQTAGCRSTSASSPSPVTTWHHPLRRRWSWGMMADGMMAWWQGFPWHPVECRLVSHARCHCKQIYCLMRLGMN